MRFFSFRQDIVQSNHHIFIPLWGNDGIYRNIISNRLLNFNWGLVGQCSLVWFLDPHPFFAYIGHWNNGKFPKKHKDLWVYHATGAKLGKDSGVPVVMISDTVVTQMDQNTRTDNWCLGCQLWKSSYHFAREILYSPQTPSLHVGRDLNRIFPVITQLIVEWLRSIDPFWINCWIKFSDPLPGTH